MKVLVFGGSGKMGATVAWDLAKNSDNYQVEAIGIAGRNGSALEEVKKWIGSNKVSAHILDVHKQEEALEIIRQYDICVFTLPDRSTSYQAAELAINAGVNIVDILEEYHRKPDAFEIEGLNIPEGMSLAKYGEHLHQKAIDKGISFVDGAGFAPGITNFTIGEGISKLDRAVSAIARCGGIPAPEYSRNHPLRYMITWAFDHVLRQYMIKVDIRKDGKVILADAATELEKFEFNQLGIHEQLECAITPGMPSLLHTRPELLDCYEKTIRWPGHWEGIQTFKECGLLNTEPVDFKNCKIAPREFLSQLLTPQLQPKEGETDICVMWSTVTGIKNGKNTRFNYYMWEGADVENNISAMGRVTAFTASIAAMMLGNGEIKQKGIIAPEDAFLGANYEKMIAELKKRGVTILEIEETLS